MVVSSKRQTVVKILLIVASVLVFWLIYQLTENNYYNLLFKSSLHKKILLIFQDPQLDLPTVVVKKNFKKVQKNVIIVAHGRSGSTITGDLFNHHPSVFYLFEPLQTVQRISYRQNKTSKDDYGNLMVDILTKIFRCNFGKKVVEDFERFYRDPSHLRVSHAIASPPLCPHEMSDPSLCPPMTSESLEKVCANDYKINVAKVLMSRIAEGSIYNILTACNPTEVDCKIILLIRDPRAVIASSRSVGFFKDTVSDPSRKNLRKYSHEKCKQTEENLELVKNLPLSWRKRIIIQRYEDFAMKPLDGLLRLFQFAGLSVPDSVKIWLNQTTQPSKDHEELKAACRGYDPAVCTVDESSLAVNRWRWKVPLADIVIMEQYCRRVMGMMGYRPVDQSYELMSNISVPLFSEEYEVKEWK